MKKQILALLATTLITSGVIAGTQNCSDGYDNLEHLGSCLGSVVDSSIGILVDLPSDAKKWSSEQHIKAKQKLETIKNNICNNTNPVKEVIVEKIIYIDRIIKVPSKVRERRCVIKKQSDRFGNTREVTTCTEWK